MRTRLLILLVITCAAQVAQARPVVKHTGKYAADQAKGTTVQDETSQSESFIGKMRRRLEKIAEEQKEEPKTGFIPMIGSIETTSGVAVGGAFRSRWLQASAAYSFRRFQDYNLQFGIGAPRPKFLLRAFRWSDVIRQTGLHKNYSPNFLYADLRYKSLPQEIFYVEPLNQDPIRTDFALKETYFGVVAGHQFDQRVRADVRVGLLRTDPGEGKDDQHRNLSDFFDPAIFPELTESIDFLRISAAMVFDDRDQRGNPHTGRVVGAMFAHYDDRDSNVFDFNQFTLDARQFIPLFRPGSTLALRFVTFLSSEQDQDSRIPFYLQSHLGGSHTIRGYARYRFRGPQSLAASIEYRYDIKRWLEVAPFFDIGKVFKKRSDFGFDHLKNSYGVGVRIKTPSTVLFRVDLAHSSEETKIHAGFGSAF